MANNDKITLDSKEFARSIISSNPIKDGEDEKAYIKRQLRLYLEAVLLVDDFNNLEETRFDVAKSEQRNSILQKIIERRY
ncbi:hypothetical protein FC83_GL001553 [Agrilactobacillus composti DSM 18527 = JCM 14202]|uniref:Uncharacterized protein n=1 Tax=Agrilactobacillus composti DSM 18527 = JCM 14202 TaxID=1423734 RepID=X0QJU5_9LACO|nr:hypothetical protein [Agrilactobacillus composti]KRM30422.1 hypothetical protein FC83_GL001553 [Agrilactobacillus composti DSM 18527 = JCM 14202]GAF38895.1 hypothetical protein JCM14202_726 [Agrilactobacillus composti DSM 18527 = JCM 14202]